jgi:hypothetical protein
MHHGPFDKCHTRRDLQLAGCIGGAVNNPFPTQIQLRSELAVDRLLEQQAATTRTFQRIIIQARAAVEALHFPLGSPAHGYDLADIIATLGDWLVERDPDQLQEYAEDAVLTLLSGEP